VNGTPALRQLHVGGPHTGETKVTNEPVVQSR
jgi:hypothetical protein